MKLKKGDTVDIRLSEWRGTPATADGRNAGMRLQVTGHASNRLLVEFELSIEQLGYLLAGHASEATVHLVPLSK